MQPCLVVNIVSPPSLRCAHVTGVHEWLDGNLATACVSCCMLSVTTRLCMDPVFVLGPVSSAVFPYCQHVAGARPFLHLRQSLT